MSRVREETYISRPMQIGVGILLLLFALPSLVYAVWAAGHVFVAHGKERTADLLLAAIFLPLAGGGVTYAIRLLRGYGPDGKMTLLSPFAFRLAGGLIIIFSIMAIADGNIGELAGGLLHLGTGIGLFAVARRRERIDPAEPLL